MNKKLLISTAVLGIVSYFGYRVMKQINDIDFDFDFVGENIDDYYNTSTSESSSQGYAERKES
jgi:hypothetical protein